MQDIDNRLSKAKHYCERVFSHEDFKKPKAVKEILTASFECNASKLLTVESEILLFKRMNYFKYKAKRLLDVKGRRVSESRLLKAESFIEKAKQVRNFIAESNFRLATQILKCNISYYKKNSLVDSLLSDAYFDIIKSVDYFNWTLGNRFSTYATWVLKKNFFRESKESQKRSKKVVRLEDSDVKFQVNKSESTTKVELDHKSNQQIVSILLGMLENSDCTKDQKRQVFIIESYFGLNGKEDCTLEQISEKLGITKERVRQLKEKGLNWLRERIKQMNLDYEVVFESFRY